MRITAQDGAHMEIMQLPDRKRPQLVYFAGRLSITGTVIATFNSTETAEQFCRFFEATTQVRTDIDPIEEQSKEMTP